MGFSSAGASSAALNQPSATSTAAPSLKSKQSAVSITSPSESDFSPNDDTTRPGVLGGEQVRLSTHFRGSFVPMTAGIGHFFYITPFLSLSC